jgi:hypothetical protein
MKHLLVILGGAACGGFLGIVGFAVWSKTYGAHAYAHLGKIYMGAVAFGTVGCAVGVIAAVRIFRDI